MSLKTTQAEQATTIYNLARRLGTLESRTATLEREANTARRSPRPAPIGQPSLADLAGKSNVTSTIHHYPAGPFTIDASCMLDAGLVVGSTRPDPKAELREALTLVIEQFDLAERYGNRRANTRYPEQYVALPGYNTDLFLADLKLAKEESDRNIAYDEALTRLYGADDTDDIVGNVTPIFRGPNGGAA